MEIANRDHIIKKGSENVDKIRIKMHCCKNITQKNLRKIKLTIRKKAVWQKKGNISGSWYCEYKHSKRTELYEQWLKTGDNNATIK